MTSSSSSVPTLVHGVGMMVGGGLVAVVVLGAVVITAVLTQKLTGRSNFLSRYWDASKMVLPAAGALLIGSASGGVAWSSTLYTPPKVAEPERVQAAYKNIKSIETEEVLTAQKAEANGTSSDSIEVARSVLGSKFDEVNEEYNLDGTKDHQKTFSTIEYVPSADDSQKSDPCYKVKVSYRSKVDHFDPKAPTVEHSAWVVPDNFDSAACGGDAQEF